MSTTDITSSATASRRRLTVAMLVITTAQLMLVLDDSVANIALPTIGRDLDMSATGLPWVISAYVLVFGALLLLGGRVGDLYGRRRVFRAGVAVFTVASLLGGLAPDGASLIAARVLQGLGAALAAPNALALIRSTFPEGEARNKAIGAYGAMSGLGIVGGLLLGGLLTGTVGWRAVFLINVPIGLAVLAGTRTLVGGERHRGLVDLPGAVTVTAGMASLAYAFTNAGEHGWGDTITLAAFAAAAVLLTAFVLLQHRGSDPLLPLRVLADRSRAASYTIMLVVGAALMGTFYVITLWMQQVAGYGAIRTGLAWLPFALGIMVGTVASSTLISRVAPRLVAAGGLVLAAAAAGWFSLLDSDSTYLAGLLPGIFTIALALGLAFPPLTLATVQGIEENVAGVAAALLNASQQLGAAIGLALLTAVSATAADSRLPDATGALQQAAADGDAALISRAADALTYGYTRAVLLEAVLLLVAAGVAALALAARPASAAELVEVEHAAA
jgi:EmrB/QacA subfamily drug resistance transporter